MLLLFLFVLLFLCLCVCVFFCFLFLTRDSNMISMGTVELRHYYIAIIIPVNLGKP